MTNFVRVLSGWFAFDRQEMFKRFWRNRDELRKPPFGDPNRRRDRQSCAVWASFVAISASVLLIPHLAYGAEDDDTDAERSRQKLIVTKFLSVLEKNPRRGTALDRVYGHHVEWGTLDEYVSGLKQKTQTNSKDAASWMLLGLMEAQRGRDAEAIDAFRQAETQAPKNALASYYLGLSLNLIGQPDEAVAALERAIERKPAPADLLEIYQQLGRMHQRAQRNDQALLVWSRLEAEFPSDVRVQEQIAIALLEDGQVEQALPRYEALAKKTKDDYRRTVFLIQVAELKVKLNQRDEGLRALEATMANLNPDSWLHRDIRRRVEDIFLRSGDQDGLVAYYEKWIGAHSEDVDAMARLARFLARSARVPEATNWLDKALKLAPTRKELRIAFIDQLVDDQRFGEAAQQYEQLDKSDPNNPDYLRDWGRMILRDKQRPKEERVAAAEAIWTRLAESKPNDPLIAAQVADLFRHQEISEPALRLYRRAVELSPDEPQYREYLGEYLHLLKKPEQALAVWREIVAGKRRNVTNLTRLAEVLSNHGFQDEALKYMADACKLDPKDFSLQLKSADYHSRAAQYPSAFEYIAAAEKLAANDEERESVLNERIKVLQSSQTIDGEIDALAAKIEMNPSANAWYVLARYYEADRRQPEAAAAIEKSLTLEPKSITALTAAARMLEQGGDWGPAADRFRQLAEIDRRYRSEHLTHVARLEAQLGRTAEALAAGKALIAAAPGNTSNYETYAELCFRLGQNDEGLDTLRKAIRINPNEPPLIMLLAAKLAEQLRTDEAIQLYWQAFEKAESNEDRIGIVIKLAELHLQINQFDKLTDRLDRDRREEEKRRSLTICLAQAHHTAGDFGSARQELESLLGRETRDSELLNQLSKLCEAEQDFESALQFQQQLARVAPGPETEHRLASLYLSAGYREEASALMVSLAKREEDQGRRLKAIDGLLRNSNYEAASSLIDAMLREQPQNWELIYRDAVAWASLDRVDEARLRFQRILEMDLPLDALSQQAQDRLKQEQMKAKTNAALGRSSSIVTRATPFTAIERVYEIQRAVGLQQDYNQGSGPQPVYVPSSFGEARMATLGWLLKFENRAGRGDEFVASTYKRGSTEAVASKALMDSVYLSSLRNDGKTTFETARRLAASGGQEEQRFFLMSLNSRTQSPDQQNYYDNSTKKQDTTPPLSDDDLELMIKCVRAVVEPEQSQNQMASYRRTAYVAGVGKELKRAKRDPEPLIEELVRRKHSVDLVAACNWAAGEHHVDKTLDLYGKWSKERLAELAKPGRQQQNRGLDPTQAIIQMMGMCALDKANDDLLRVMDRLLDHSAAAAATLRAKETRKTSNVRSNRNQQGMQTWYGEQQNYVQVDFPIANEYLDFNALMALRQAYESFKRNDVVSDLAPHLKRRAEAATGLDKVAALQALGAVYWWNDEKEDATAQFVAAAELIPQDQSLKLDLAMMHSSLSDFDTALDVIDQIVPRDQKLLQARELMALQFAERLGDVDRARAAAERLFGVRLDPQQQIALAGYMRRLGLTALADAVTSRAQRSSGNQLSAQMTLMTLYHGQGKTKEALQLAHQLLRRTTPAMTVTSRRNRGGNQNEQYRQQALQFLSQTGQLPEMIERLEKAKSNTQASSRLSAQLAELYTAAGKRDKALELVAEMVQQQPDDAMAHLQYGQQLEQAGKAADACEQYLIVLKLRPEMLSDDLYRYGQIFQQANKGVMLAEALEKLNLKAVFNNYWSVMNVAQPLLQNKETRDVGLKLFRRVYQEFVNERQYVFQYLHDDELWNLPEVFEMAKESVIPSKALVVARPWQGLENIYSYGQDGRVNSSVTRVLDAAKRLNRMAELRTAINDRVQGQHDWPAGLAILALIDAKDGKKAEAEQILRDLVKDERAMKSLPPMGKWIIGQEIEAIPELQDRAIQLLEEAATSGQMNNEFQYSPYARLVHLYKSANRRDQALKIMRDASKAKSNVNYDRDYETYRRISTLTSLADQFMKFDSPVDAISLYRDLLSNTSHFAVAARWNGDGDGSQQKRQCEKGLARALAGLKGENASEGIRFLLSPANKVAQGGQLVDLMIIAPDVRDLAKSTMNSAIVDLIKTLVKEPDLRTSVVQQVELLSRENPDDLSLGMLRCLIAIQTDFSGSRPAIEQLVQLVDKQPLDELDAGKRPNARQRAQAVNQIPLWLIGRKCLEETAFTDFGEKLGTRAVAAARRQLDFNYTASILYEWGQIEWKQGRKDAAAEHWSELLDATTLRPKSDRKKAAPREATPKPVPVKAQPVGQRNQRRFDGIGGRGQMTALLFAAIGADPAVKQPRNAAPVSSKNASSEKDGFIPPLTYPQFNAAIAVAKLAAEHQLQKLSFRAVDEALKGGPPVQAAETGENSMIVGGGGRVIRSTTVVSQPGQLGNVSSVTPESFMMVARSLRSLATIWEKNHFPDEAVYAVLVPHVLPPDKPGEIKIYLEDDGLSSGRSASLAATLIPWAQRAQKLTELKQQVTERSQQTTAALNGQVVLTLIALREQDDASAKASLQKIAGFLEKDKAAENQSVACHAAVAGFGRETLRDVTSTILLEGLQARTIQGNTLDGTFVRGLFRYLSSQGNLELVKKRLDEYLAVRQGQNSRNGGDYGLYQQQQDLARTAQVASASGLIDLALNYIGQANDTPTPQYYYGSYDIAKPLYAVSRQIATRSPEERYKVLSDWTLPTATRKRVRFELTWNRSQDIDPAFLPKSDLDAENLSGTTLSNFEQLVEAAQTCGKLDEVLSQVNAAAAEDLPNAKHLQAFVHLKKNDLTTATPLLKELMAAMEKRAADPRNSNRTAATRCDFLIARTALERPELADLAREYSRLLLGNSRKLPEDLLMHLRIADAHRQVADEGLPPLTTGDDPGLSFWTSFAPRRLSAYTYPTWWIPADGDLIHMNGIGNDLLNTRFPITGDFEFSVDAYCNSWAEGNIGYAGISVEALDVGSPTEIQAVDEHESIQRPNPLERVADFNRLTVQQKAGKVRFFVNHSLVYEETAGTQSPWLNLRAGYPTRVAFRNPQLTGNPIIPREVALVDKDRLDGWVTAQFNDTQPQRRVQAEPDDVDTNNRRGRQDKTPPAIYDWEAKDGRLIGNRRDDVGINVQSRIYYFRPLASGDRVRYEFRYEPGQVEIHPSVGKVAFLLKPEGVRLHWITDLNWDAEVYGIDPANQFDAPPEAGAAGPLNLKAGDWNSVEITYQNGTVTLHLNGQQICQRVASSKDECQFGFFRFKDQSAAEIRNIVLTGDWPTEIPDAMKSSPFMQREKVSDELQQARYAAVGDYFHQLDAADVWRKSLRLNDEERYQALKDWVIPNATHTTFRLVNFNPPVGAEIPAKAHLTTLGNGSRFAAPVWELIAVAKTLSRIEDLRKECAAASERNALARRGKWAFQLMLAASAGEEDQVRALAQKLQTALAATEYRLPEWTLWPEYTAALSLIDHPKLDAIAIEFAQKQLDKSRKYAEDGWVIPRLSPVLRTLEMRRDGSSRPTQQLAQWKPGSVLTAEARGRGKYPAKWIGDRGKVEQFPGAFVQPLYFQSPLVGDFELSADVSLQDNRDAIVGYAMAGISPFPDRNGIRSLSMVRSEQKIERKFPAGAIDGKANVRMVVKNKQTTWFVNGVEMNSAPLPTVADPWVVLRGRTAHDQCAIENLQITGTPQIPESISLSAVSDLANWRADDYGDYSGQESDQSAPWCLSGEEIVARLRKDPAAPDQPSLLVYQRPLTFDGELNYEFYYKPKDFEVHPALGQICWLIAPDGVRRRRLNNAQWEPDEVLATMKPSDAETPTGPALNLKTDDWNTARLRWQGNSLTVWINDQEIAREEIDEASTRQFGLFRFSERNQCRIRNVILRGDWPKALPAVRDQELSQPSAEKTAKLD